MAETIGELRRIRFRQVCPWVHLFRGFRIALWPPGKLILAAAAILLLPAGDRAFSYLFGPESSSPMAWPWQAELGYVVTLRPDARLSPASQLPLASSSPDETMRNTGNQGLSSRVLDHPGEFLWSAATNWPLILKPLRTLIDPVRPLFDRDSSWSEVACAWSRVLWALAVWAVFGGAISRIAAVQFARDVEIGIWPALKFSGTKFLSYVTAPLLPMVFFGVFWVLSLLAGLFGRIPVVGEAVVAVLWFLPLLFGLAMAVTLLFLAVTWPLMFATISVEGSDAFDGFSRSYGYLFDRPWHYLWLAVVGMTYGSAVVFVVFVLGRLTSDFADWSVGSGMGTAEFSGPFAAAAAGFWRHALSVLIVGFVYSYFWSAVTIVYFLLRQSDDATELNEVFLPESEDTDDLLPLMGVAESEQPIVERPTGDVSSPERNEDDSRG